MNKKTSLSAKEERRLKRAISEGNKLAKKYPDLAPVPPEERLIVLRKALFHPLLLLFALFLAVGVLPRCLEFFLQTFAISLTPITVGSALLLFACSAVLFGGVFFLLRSILIPISIRHSVRRLGYTQEPSLPKEVSPKEHDVKEK
jgi:hypothetical protein